MKHRFLFTAILLCVSTAEAALFVQANGVDPQVIINRVVQVDRQNRQLVRTLTVESQLLEGELKDTGFVEKSRATKTIYVRFFEDSAWFQEMYTSLSENGKPKSDEELKEYAAKKIESKKKRKSQDISFPILRPFYPGFRDLYDITSHGTVDNINRRYTCYHFTVTAKSPADTLIEGEYYFEVESFQLARVDFHPSKLTKNLMFKLNRLDMTLLYAPDTSGAWLPREFHAVGKGKAAIIFGVNFAIREYYRNPVINNNLSDTLFARR